MLESAQERIDKACVLRQSGGVLVHGFRGVGKSSLIDKIVDMADSAQPGVTSRVFVLKRALSKTTSDSELYQMITESLLEDIAKKQSLAGHLEKIKEQVKVVGIPGVLELQIDESWKQKTPYFRWRSVLDKLKGAQFVLVAIDDADYLSPEAIRELKTIVEDKKEVPVLLVVSGGTDFEARLVNDFSPIRIFSGASFNLSSFVLEETKEVLENPIRDQPDVSWTTGAIYRLQEITKGYPFLVQCLAKASYRQGQPIDEQRVNASIDASLENGKSWLDNKLKLASDQDLISFYKIGRSNRTSFRSADLSKMGVPAPYVGRLVTLKVIKPVSRGHYDLIEAPMIAYYHVLKRHLSIGD